MHMAACLPIILCIVLACLRCGKLQAVNKNSLLTRSMANN